MVFAGCKKENETNGTTLKASIEQHKGNGSKTSLHPISDTEAEIHWTGAESILVNNGTSTVTFSLVSKSDDGMSGTFNYDGSFTFGENNVAVYPETATLSIDGSTVGFTLPETQTFTAEGTFGEGMNPMLGTFTDPENFTMTSLCGVLGLQLTGDNVENVTSIEVESKLDEALNGEFSCTAANPVLSVVTAGTNKVKLEFQEPITLTSTAKKFYFVLPVGTLSGGFTLTVNIEGAEPITRSTTNDISIVLNCVNMMPEMPISAAPTVPTGAINALFSVSLTQQVYFSKGNLQYIGSASTPYWKFADNQWDYFGKTTGQNGTNQNVDRDLFGWGTWTGSATNPANTSSNDTDYSWDNSDFVKTLQNGSGTWRTLTSDEWLYLFNTRASGATVTTTSGTTNDARYTQATINTDGTGVNGIILFPDGVTIASDEATTWGAINGSSAWGTKCTAAQWEALDAKGCVFLPAAGFREGTSVDSVGTIGLYWSSEANGPNHAKRLYFFSNFVSPQYGNFRRYGQSVRLVQDYN